ncbi:transposable element Tcb1 transposase [Trichonephila clavipes]|nr:transposable element Tcb1 transposase [Trichonephila clavipes]
MHRHTSPAPGIMVWGGVGFHCHTSLVSIAVTPNSQRYISEVLESVVLPYIQRLPSAVFQQNNVQPHVAHNVFKSSSLPIKLNCFLHLACSPDLSPILNVWPMLAQLLSWDTPPTATPEQLWQCRNAT